MGQSKRPAVCACSCVGPVKGGPALAAGWKSKRLPSLLCMMPLLVLGLGFPRSGR